MESNGPLSSPHIHNNASVGRVMATVLLALLPVVAAYVWLWGVPVVLQLATAAVTALVVESIILTMRRMPVRTALLDGSALVTALLLAFCLPPTAPLWVVAVGVGFAVVVAKHLYGGLGFNLFNPAMAGYLVVLIAFPAQLSLWPVPDNPWDDREAQISDSVTQATPLDQMRSGRLQGKPVAEAMIASPLFGLFANGVTALLALAWLAGGVLLLVTGTIRWRIPLALLASLGLFATICAWVNPQLHAGAMF
ncbi:MAG: RnfABCDGE type electron transport complex subunit D, partial [Gammaproteobacteria bacterium]